MRYWTIQELLREVPNPDGRTLYEFYTKYSGRFAMVQGSQHNHQAWVGGYMDHVVETMNIARVLYHSLSSIRPLEFGLGNALKVLFLHDIEKLFPERILLEQKIGWPRPKAKNLVRYRVLHDEKLWDILSNSEKNAIDHTEGEQDYDGEHRKMLPLAAFCHMCDVMSARIWFDQPADNDKWGWRKANGPREMHNDEVQHSSGRRG